MNTIQIGVHTSISGGIHNAVESQISKGGNCGQIFSHSPQSWAEPDPSRDEIEEFRRLSAENNVQPWVIHASYLVNLCTPKDDLGRKSLNSIQSELDIASELGIPYVNVHLGAHTGAGVESGLQNAAQRINSLRIPDNVSLVIESDAGGGTKLGDDIQHLATIQSLTTHTLEFCIDTAHIWAAGYNIDSKDGVESMFSEFDELVGLDYLSVIHLNDSKHGLGTNKDEHDHLGFGKIGEEGISEVAKYAGERNIPIIAETPITDDRGDEENIQFVRNIWNNTD